MKDDYSDIINLPRHISKKRQPMPIIDRAAQFAPFAALTGYEDAINETGRSTEQKIVLHDSHREVIDRRLRFISDNIDKKIPVKITYFEKDAKKSGGKYITVEESIKKYDKYNLTITLESNLAINIKDIYDITSPKLP